MSTSAKKIVLRSSDDKIFEVDEAVALQCKTVGHMIEDDCVENGVPLPNVTGKILAKVLEFCKKHVPVVVPDADADDVAVADPSPSSVEELKEWDDDFINEMDQATLLDVCQAADYLSTPKLLDLTCKAVAEMIRGKTPDEMRAFFRIVNDFTAEEEAEVRRANQWAFE
ncbi:unnamed protein product [Microthlaspi erraticum]|uniref:SKP1-like protein n=1 Tax=Microthlaspi erraticum TaxID=1685480 RepID=A0A6D2K585_9BRAS|nr:unnamed protein product [Microthlaspi erraticum]